MFGRQQHYTSSKAAASFKRCLNTSLAVKISYQITAGLFHVYVCSYGFLDEGHLRNVSIS